MDRIYGTVGGRRAFRLVDGTVYVRSGRRWVVTFEELDVTREGE